MCNSSKMADEDIIKTRLLTDNRSFKKCWGRFSALVQAAKHGSEEEKRQSLEQFLLDLKLFRLSIHKFQMINDMNEIETNDFNKENEDIGKWDLIYML
jgi:Tho complex subunit 7